MTAMIAVIIPSMVDGGRPYAQRALQDNEVMMTTVQELRLPDEAYHSHLNAPFDRAAQALASDESGGSSPAVLRLGLTRIIDLSRTSVVPGAVLRQYSGLRLWEVDNDQNLSFIIVDLRTGAVEVAKAFQTERRMAQPTSSRSGPEPSGIDRRVVHSGVQRFNLPPVFGEQWPSPAFAVTAVLYDWVSNTAVIERQPPPAPAADPTGVPSPFLDRAASRGAMAGSPGFVVDIPASVPQGAALKIAGTLNVPSASVALLQSAEQPDGRLMAATLLLMALDAEHPIALRLLVPVKRHGETVSATFAFDLAQRPEGARLAGHYKAYFVSGRTVVGPQSLTVESR